MVRTTQPEIILIGDQTSKRSIYFKKACDELNISLTSISYNELDKLDDSKQTFVKIDPPTYESCDISHISFLTENYHQALIKLSNQPSSRFLNHPLSIWQTLDKLYCKQLLMEKNIPSTPLISEHISDIEELRRLLASEKIMRVFIKPRYGSGAAGVIAYSFNPKSNEEVIYTSVAMHNQQFINTKRISRITDRKLIESIVNAIFLIGAVVERWIPKSTYQNFSYDLRVVYQFNKIDYIVVRRSKSPITNLHLNNKATNLDNLSLPKKVLNNIESLCIRTMKQFPKLQSAGIDILLSGSELKPYIIEVNAQGDLIYDDIYLENNIYKNQIKRMVEINESK